MVNKMKRKKLKVSNMMGKDTTLSRSEMRKIMAGSGTCTCMHNGCMVTIAQGPYSWGMVIDCGDGSYTYNGSGTWGGSACGGQC